MQVEVDKKAILSKSKQILRIAKKKSVAKLSDGLNQNSIVPFSMILQPYCVSSGQFQTMKKMSYLWQKITHLASKNSQLIIQVFQNMKNDPMINPMYQIYKQLVKNQQQNINSVKSNKDIDIGKKTTQQKPKIQFFRTDFFVTKQKQNNIKLIQYNNMSVSMAGISQQFQECQKSLWQNQKNVIQNKCTETYSNCLVQFYKKFQLDGIMLVVVQSKQTNVIDQELLLLAIKSKSNIEIQKVFLQDLNKFTSIDKNNDLYFKDNKKVSVVYYRAGYSSRQKIQWSGIRKCNLSNAVNIPSVSAFLIGTKKMQAHLSSKQVMKRFLTEQEAQFLMRSVIDTWQFKEDNKQEIIKMIQKEGKQNFVLKPNEQGGKNNFFGLDAYHKVVELTTQQLKNYILTKRIQARIQSCTLIRSNQWNQPETEYCKIQSQVSIYGCVYSQCKFDGEFQLKNCCGGFLVRCKPQGVNQGGLMAGTGALGSLQIRN